MTLRLVILLNLFASFVPIAAYSQDHDEAVRVLVGAAQQFARYHELDPQQLFVDSARSGRGSVMQPTRERARILPLAAIRSRVLEGGFNLTNPDEILACFAPGDSRRPRPACAFPPKSAAVVVNPPSFEGDSATVLVIYYLRAPNLPNGESGNMRFAFYRTGASWHFRDAVIEGKASRYFPVDP
ncbi:MAG: hypothetical protein H0U67_03170 [Gemmatimonadetes bacterium]|nr:hypothetical protein [Gemmatimonadota bacterium]